MPEDWTAGGVYAAGVFAGRRLCDRPQATVIRAIAAGKVAAANIDELSGLSITRSAVDVEIPDGEPPMDHKVLRSGQPAGTSASAAERKGDFEPD